MSFLPGSRFGYTRCEWFESVVWTKARLISACSENCRIIRPNFALAHEAAPALQVLSDGAVAGLREVGLNRLDGIAKFGILAFA